MGRATKGLVLFQSTEVDASEMLAMVKAKFGCEMGYDGYFQVYLDQSAAVPAIGGRWISF